MRGDLAALGCWGPFSLWCGTTGMVNLSRLRELQSTAEPRGEDTDLFSLAPVYKNKVHFPPVLGNNPSR